MEQVLIIKTNRENDLNLMRQLAERMGLACQEVSQHTLNQASPTKNTAQQAPNENTSSVEDQMIHQTSEIVQKFLKTDDKLYESQEDLEELLDMFTD